VKYDADKKYTFEGGSVVFTDTDPFSSKFLGLPTWLAIVIAVAVVLFVIAIVAALVFAKRARVRRTRDIHNGSYQSVDPSDSSADYSQQEDYGL
jgi:hypothetical protein